MKQYFPRLAVGLGAPQTIITPPRFRKKSTSRQCGFVRTNAFSQRDWWDNVVSLVQVVKNKKTRALENNGWYAVHDGDRECPPPLPL